jgi:hypothetical protein
VSSVQSSAILDLSGEFLMITFTRPADASDLTFFPEFSTHPAGPWSPGFLDVSAVNADTVTETWRSPATISAEPKQFGRLRVVNP